MSPNVIRDEFSHIPDANKRMRLRWQKEGRCKRCGEGSVEDGYSYGPRCLAYMKAKREKQRRVA